MPTLTGTPVVRRAWRYRTEPNRIHFVANGGSADRHLYADRGDPLYAVLDEALTAQGYTGPGERPRTTGDAVRECASA